MRVLPAAAPSTRPPGSTSWSRRRARSARPAQEAIAAARAELAAREAQRRRHAAEQRTARPAPDFRALDAAIARELEALAAVEVVLRRVELADVAIAAVVQVNKDAMRNDADPTSIGTRAFDAVHFAKDQLRAVVEELARVRDSEPALIARLSGRDLDAYLDAPVTLAVELGGYAGVVDRARAVDDAHHGRRRARPHPRPPGRARAAAARRRGGLSRRRRAVIRGRLKKASGLRPQASKIETFAPVVRLRIRNPRPEA